MAIDLDVGLQYENLPDILGKYEDEYEVHPTHTNLKSMPVGEAARDLPEWQRYYGVRYAELKKLLAFMESRVAQVRGKLFMGVKKSSNVALNQSEIMRYVDADEDFMRVNRYMLEVKELCDKYGEAINTCKTIGYSLNNITKLLIEGHEDYML